MTVSFRTARSAWIAALVAGLIVLGGAAPGAVLANEIEFEQPAVEARLGEPIVFQATMRGADRPDRADLLLSLPGERAVSVVPAVVSGSAGAWQLSAVLEGHSVPNTTYAWQFRVRGAFGTALGPQAEVTVVDERFEWRTISGSVVRLHWYEGDQRFAARALDIGERAVARASELLGVTETEPIDFFIYATTQDMYSALGPGTRENVGGQAHADIRTMFGLIEPNEIESDWVDTLVAHELTHLVFDTATENPYRTPPRWLNEGVAVYLSDGYSAAWRAPVEQAARNGTLIPLDGLGGLFPTTATEFRLAYGISVSAIDYFVATHGEQTLWQLVRSYAEGVSDDDAFIAATGADLAAFNAAWMGSLSVEVPEPFGPRPAPTGPVPADWQVDPAQPTGRPQPTEPAGPAPLPTTAPGATADPATPGTPPVTDGQPEPAVLAVMGVVIVLLAVLLVALLVMAARARREPPPPPSTWR